MITYTKGVSGNSIAIVAGIIIIGVVMVFAYVFFIDGGVFVFVVVFGVAPSAKIQGKIQTKRQ